MPEISTSLALPERRAVCSGVVSHGSFSRVRESVLLRQEEELTLERRLVTQDDLTRLHHKCETGIEGVTGLGLLLGGHLD